MELHKSYRKAGVVPGDKISGQCCYHAQWVVITLEEYDSINPGHAGETHLDGGYILMKGLGGKGGVKDISAGIAQATEIGDPPRFWKIFERAGERTEAAPSPLSKDQCPNCKSMNTGWVSLELKCLDCHTTIC